MHVIFWWRRRELFILSSCVPVKAEFVRTLSRPGKPSSFFKLFVTVLIFAVDRIKFDETCFDRQAHRGKQIFIAPIFAA